MCARRSLAVTLVVVALAALSAGCSSSPKAVPSFSHGLTNLFTPDGAPAPVLPASFVNCLYRKLSASDRTDVGNIKSSSGPDAHLPDPTSVRMTRAADQCDPTLTNQLFEASVFAGAPASISGAQKTCATGKIISILSSLDDSKLKSTNNVPVASALEKASKACGIGVSS